MKDYAPDALAQGYRLELIPYTDERLAAESFKKGLCDGVFITDLRVRPFNTFTGTFSAIGGLNGSEATETLLQLLASDNPKITSKLTQGPYEVAGVGAMGSVYLFVNNREAVKGIASIQGKRIAVLDYDPSQALMAESFGAVPVSSDVTYFSSKFNNGAVDILATPLAAYHPLELYKGVGKKGGVIDYPVSEVSLQFIIRSKAFDPKFGASARTWFFNNRDIAAKVVKEYSEQIPDDLWIELPKEELPKYDNLIRKARIRLAKEKKVYDLEMLHTLKQVRCHLDASRAECSDNLE
jgi:hypothetical protein